MNQEYYRKLQQGRIILESSEHGIPTWRSHGIEVARRMETTFNEIISTDWNLTKVSIPTLVEQEKFDNFYKEINPKYLESAYRIADQNQILKCDPFLGCAPFIKEKCLNSPDSAIGITSPLFRYVDSKPLMVDRKIWPVIGIYAASDRESSSISMDRLYHSFKKFYDQICLPTFFVYQKNFGNYAKQMILPIAPLDKGELTVMATIFELSSLFSEKIEVKSSLFEAGISEKNITVFYALQAEREHVTLPRSLSPVEVSVLSENDTNCEQLINYLDNHEIRYSLEMVDNHTKKNKAKAAEAKGIPLIVHIKQGKTPVYWMSFNNQKGELESLINIECLLNESDNEIKHFNQRILNESLEGNINVINGVCPECAKEILPNHDYYGSIYPIQSVNCSSCGSISQLSYYLNRNTTGTIREKNQERKA